MPDVIPKLGSVVLNVTDLDRAVAFWSQLLGVKVGREIPGFFVWLRPQNPGGISVALQLAGEGKPEGTRNRVHLDTAVDDLDAAHARVVELGGSHVETHDMMGFSWRIMADPEGNEFCIAKPS